jgi:hypothetical protein
LQPLDDAVLATPTQILAWLPITERTLRRWAREGDWIKHGGRVGFQYQYKIVVKRWLVSREQRA